MSLAAGTRLGPYEILAPLGAGGMGEVYRATDTRLGRTVALKVLPEDFLEGEERRRRASRRRRSSLASLNHPNVATLYSFEEIPGSPPSSPCRHVLTMELLEGESLREVILRRDADDAAGALVGAPGGAGSRRRAREGHRPPRHQARKPLPDFRRPHQDPRLRSRQADARGRRSIATPRRNRA